MTFMVAMLLALVANPQGKETMIDSLKGFEPYLGKTWKGTFANSTPEKPQYDIVRWERALNGRAVRVVHSVNDGQYGGESLILWDSKKQSIGFFYFTTAGFYTSGTIKQEGSKFLSHEIRDRPG